MSFRRLINRPAQRKIHARVAFRLYARYAWGGRSNCAVFLATRVKSATGRFARIHGGIFARKNRTVEYSSESVARFRLADGGRVGARDSSCFLDANGTDDTRNVVRANPSAGVVPSVDRHRGAFDSSRSRPLFPPQ